MLVHQKISAALRRKITEGYQPGDCLPAIRQLARHFKVSTATIGQALAVLQHEGLIEGRHGSGIYVKAQTDPRWIGVLLETDFAAPDASYFWREAAQQARFRLTEHGERSRLYAGFRRYDSQSIRLTCPEFDEDVRNNRLKGVLCAHGSPSPDLMELLNDHGVPMVGYLSGHENSVTYDLPGLVYTATCRLLEHGRRKVALINYGNHEENYTQAFSEALTKHGVPLDTRWVRGDFHPQSPGGGWEEFREIWIGSTDKPDALIVADDVLFRSVARAITEFGIRVPEELLVVTHSTNAGVMEDYPFPLWRMVTDPDLVAKEQVDLLLALLQDQPVAQRRIFLPGQLLGPDGLPIEPRMPATAAAHRSS